MTEHHDVTPKRETEAALVVEGGAMRGIFAAGVLDAFIKGEYNPFRCAYGVSAGSTNLIGYLASDYERSRRIITDHACRADFINWRRFLRGGHLCDVHWLWHQSFADEPLSFKRYLAGHTELWVSTTSIRTGKACFFLIDEKNVHDVLTASCAIPFAYRDFPCINGEPMTDGGLASSIPVLEAYDRGARDITVVLSRSTGYRKRPPRFKSMSGTFLRRHPQLLIAMQGRAERYNRALDFIERPPADCQVKVIAPPVDFPVGRLTRHPERLQRGYRAGYSAGERYLERYG